MSQVVGIDRKIKRAWLDAALDRLAQATDNAGLRTFLDKHMKEELPGKESRAKTTGIVLRIWSNIPPERVALRDRALALLPRISGQERIWLHWGMTSLAYPFFRDTAEVVGRLLALQDDFTTAQVQARMLTNWGDRATSKQATQKLITTLVDWEVLRSTKTKGHFLLARKMTASTPGLQLWLLEALLRASAADEIEAQQLLRLPESFPFALSVGVADLRKSDRLTLHRQGLDTDMVALVPTRVPPPSRPKKKKSKKGAEVRTPSFFPILSDRAASGHGENGTVVSGKSVAVACHDESLAEPIPTPHVTRTHPVQGDQPVEAITNVMMKLDRPALSLEVGKEFRGPFSASLMECLSLYRKRLDFGCIALAHALFEAMLRLVCHVKLGPRQAKATDIRTQFAPLCALGILPVPLKTRLEQSWLERIDYQGILPTENEQREKTARIAEHYARLLIDLEHHFFGYALDEGRILPDHPEYWPSEKGKLTADRIVPAMVKREEE